MDDTFTVPPLSKQVSSQRYFHLWKEPPEDEIRVFSAGRETCDPDYVIDRPGFPGYAIEFVTEGTGHLLLDGHSHPLYAGVAFAYGPGIPHRIVSSTKSPLTKYFVNFAGGDAEEILNGCGLPPGRAVRSMDLAAIGVLIELIIQDGAADEESAGDVCVLYLQAIVRKLARGVPPTSPAESDAFARFQQWRAFIDLNFLTLRDLDDIAQALHVGSAQLCRGFKRFSQVGPFHYLTRRKMNHAAGLLATREIQVKQVAEQTGYPDPYHFSRLFKRHFGHSPREFVALYRRC